MRSRESGPKGMNNYTGRWASALVKELKQMTLPNWKELELNCYSMERERVCHLIYDHASCETMRVSCFATYGQRIDGIKQGGGELVLWKVIRSSSTYVDEVECTKEERRRNGAVPNLGLVGAQDLKGSLVSFKRVPTPRADGSQRRIAWRGIEHYGSTLTVACRASFCFLVQVRMRRMQRREHFDLRANRSQQGEDDTRRVTTFDERHGQLLALPSGAKEDGLESPWTKTILKSWQGAKKQNGELTLEEPAESQMIKKRHCITMHGPCNIKEDVHLGFGGVLKWI